MNSIRRRIITFLLGSLLVINTLSGYYIYQHTKEEMEEIFNAEQAQVARTINQLVNDHSTSEFLKTSITSVPNIEDSKDAYLTGHHYEKKIAYQVWDEKGNLLLMSQNAPKRPLAAAAPGFSRSQYGNRSWHIFSLYSKTNKTWVYTAQSDEAREELIALITRDQLFSMLLVNILVLFVVVIGVTVGTRPILLLSRELSTRGGGNLSTIDMPLSQELRPIQKSINHLLQRVEETLDKEKSFSGDLSHELRTPLAAIKVHAQNLELKESLSDEGQRSLTRIIAGVGIMSKTIEQLLLLGNVETQKLESIQEDVGLLDLAKETLIILPLEIHQKNNIELMGDNIFVKGSPALLSALIRNLVENASKYSDENAPILISITAKAGVAVIDVIDRGPGMTDTQKLNSIKRRYRVSDTQTYGSGLGLSIALKIVELHRGTLKFTDHDSGKGLIASIEIPT